MSQYQQGQCDIGAGKQGSHALHAIHAKHFAHFVYVAAAGAPDEPVAMKIIAEQGQAIRAHSNVN